MNEVEIHEIKSNLIAPFNTLINYSGIKVIPYFSGIFEEFEYFLTKNEKWDLDCIKLITDKYCIDKKLLELGCGNGRVSHFLASKGYCIDGLDTSESSLVRYRELFANSSFYRFINLQIGNFFDAPFTGFGGRYSFVLLPNLTINLVREKISLLKLIAFVKARLQYGGMFCLSIFSENSSRRMSAYDGLTFSTPFSDRIGNELIMWRTYKYDHSEASLRISWFVEMRNSTKELRGFLSSAIHKFWTFVEIETILLQENFEVIDVLINHAEGGGADGYEVKHVVLRLNG